MNLYLFHLQTREIFQCFFIQTSSWVRDIQLSDLVFSKAFPWLRKSPTQTLEINWKKNHHHSLKYFYLINWTRLALDSLFTVSGAGKSTTFVSLLQRKPGKKISNSSQSFRASFYYSFKLLNSSRYYGRWAVSFHEAYGTQLGCLIMLTILFSHAWDFSLVPPSITNYHHPFLPPYLQCSLHQRKRLTWTLLLTLLTPQRSFPNMMVVFPFPFIVDRSWFLTSKHRRTKPSDLCCDQRYHLRREPKYSELWAGKGL